MYWQVYLHKTVLAGDHVLRGALDRVRALLHDGHAPTRDACAAPLLFFLERTALDLADPEVQSTFCRLDDTDVLVSLKRWTEARDPILADLAHRFIARRLPAVTFLDAPPDDATRAAWHAATAEFLVATKLATPATVDAAVPYYLQFGEARNTAYARTSPILIRQSNGTVQPFNEVSSVLSGSAPVTRPYVAHPKGVGPG